MTNNKHKHTNRCHPTMR